MVSAHPYSISFAAGLLAGAISLSASIPSTYMGTPFEGRTQQIPGRVLLAEFDQGPKGATWHDFEAKNPWACKTRDSTGVGLQIMGAGGDKGDTHEADSLVKLRMGKCYLAETNQGDWTKYTVQVKQAGVYSLSYLSAASKTDIPFVGVSLLSSKDSVGTGQVTLPITTYFHNWVYTRHLSQLALDTGTQVLRFDIVGNGPMNIDYIDFEYSQASGIGGDGRIGALRQVGAEGSGALSIGHAILAPDGTLRLDVNAREGEAIEAGIYAASGKFLATAFAAHPINGGNSISFGHADIARASGLIYVRVRQGKAVATARSFLVIP